MASWQAKQRDPLFDQNTQAALERARQGTGGAVGIIVRRRADRHDAGQLVGGTIPASFRPPTSLPENLLGSFGAYLASPLMMIAGKGAWLLVIGAVVWGLRLILHRGEERIMRAIFLPIAVALVSVYCSSLAPDAGWQQSYGMGGHFGDMVMGALLNLIPVKAQIGIKIAALLVAAGAIGFSTFVLGSSTGPNCACCAAFPDRPDDPPMIWRCAPSDAARSYRPAWQAGSDHVVTAMQGGNRRSRRAAMRGRACLSAAETQEAEQKYLELAEDLPELN